MDRPLETWLTLVLEREDAALADAHRELYPERVVEGIPFSLTLLYPWIPAAEVRDDELSAVRSFFANQRPFAFDLVEVTAFPGVVAYARPEPDVELRELMRNLWALCPQYPPYGRPGSEPAPHATLGRLTGDYATTIDQVRDRVEPLLPIRCEITEVTLIEEFALDRCRTRENFPLGTDRRP